jgi:hypothetical protein
MKKRISKVGGLLEKKGIAEGGQFEIEFPETLEEIPQFLAANDLKAERFLGMAWRGFTLSFQGAGESEPLSEEEKAIRKAARKEKNDAIKAVEIIANQQGVSLTELLKKMLGKG